jgi:hypothetical protein
MINIKNIVRIISAILLMALSGCGQSTIDATTDKSFSSTLIQVRSSVKESDLELFDETIELALKDIKHIKESEKQGYNWALKRSESLGNIHGLSSAQIVSLGHIRESKYKEAAKLRAAKRIADLEKLLLASKVKLESELMKVNNIKITNVVVAYKLQPSSYCEVKDYLCERFTIEFDIINHSNDILFDLSVIGYIPIKDRSLQFIESGILSNGLPPKGMIRVKFDGNISSISYKDIDIQEELMKVNSNFEVNILVIDFVKPFNKDKLQHYILEHEQNKDELIKAEQEPRSDRLTMSQDYRIRTLKNRISSRNHRIKNALVYLSASPYKAKNMVASYENQLIKAQPR